MSAPDELLSDDSRDRDWILAMAEALGTDSQYMVPIVPSVEAFRTLFAAVRAAPQAGVPREPTEAMVQAAYDISNEWRYFIDRLPRYWRAMYDAAQQPTETKHGA
jgi:hypothetical protein